MPYNINDYHRCSIRLKGYDYAQNGAYFITICVQNRVCLFGDIVNQKMRLNASGRMVDVQWQQLPNRFNHIKLDEYILMPNHLHGIIIVGAGLVPAQKEKRATTRVAPTKPILGMVVGGFKSITTNKYMNGVQNHDWPPFDKRLWQRNYYEHIIRDDGSLSDIREYIVHNPKNWQQDIYNRTL